MLHDTPNRHHICHPWLGRRLYDVKVWHSTHVVQWIPQVKGSLAPLSYRDQPLTLYRLSIWDLHRGHPMHRYTNKHPHTNSSIYILQLVRSAAHHEGDDMQCVLVSRHSVVSSSTYTLTREFKEWTMVCNLVLTSCNHNYKYHMHSSHSFELYLTG